MKQINIKQDETFIFEKYFSLCDTEKTGKVSLTEANKFFLKSGLAIDDLYKINEYCGANRLGYFGRSQFYIALKAISCAQSGHNVNEQIIHNNTVDLLLPRFDNLPSAEAVKTILQRSFEASSSIPPPPNKYHMRTLSGNNILHNLHQRSLMNRYKSPIVKVQGQDSPKEAADQFSVKHKSFDQTLMTHSSFFESDDDENNDESYEEEDNKGLLNSNIKTDCSHLYSLNGDDVELSSSSSDHESSSFSGDSEDNDDNGDNCCDSHDPTGYTLMEAVEGLAIIPTDKDDIKAIPIATCEQLEYYTKCFQTIQSSETGRVLGSDAVCFFQLYQLDDEHIQKILSISSIEPECEINLIQFSRALHLITHQKTGFVIPDRQPRNLLPLDFEQPDEPFSFDLSTGDQTDMHIANHVSSLDSSYSGDGDSSNFDVPDVVANRGWSLRKFRMSANSQKSSYLSKSFNSPSSTEQRDETSVVSRPRPSAKKSFSQAMLKMPPSIPNSVAPPPPPRSSVPSILGDFPVKRFSFERHADPCGDASSTSSSDKSGAEEDGPIRKMSESSKSDVPASRKHSTNSEARKQLANSIRESKARNHVLLRLNNELTSELEELREQRVNLHLQMEYIKQSQLDP